MTAPTGHYINFTLPDGKHARDCVVYVQPKGERATSGTGEERKVPQVI
jgi:hypothetical protein